MRVNTDAEAFEYEGDTDNRAYNVGTLSAFLEELAQRVESNHYSAEEYVKELKERGILED